ncbi:MAG: SDR family oxidoreductase [Acidimicrobiia bacterium]|nr:SDR family oxidoreductase [Acidimicrobiia bacterium]
MTGQLGGRVAIVTGAGDGIGAAVARAYVAEGARVTVAEIDHDKGAAVAGDLGGDALFVPTDVGDRADIEAMVTRTIEHFGTVDILVNNAWGGGEISRFERKTDQGLERAMAVGFLGPVHAMQLTYPEMRANRWGRVVNMCSLNGVNAHMGTTEYNSAKEALRSATRTAAREWAPTGVTANIICPAAKSASFRAVMAQHPELEAAADQGNPMGRIGDPDADVAPVAVFLASEASRYVTGNTLFVDGGGHINGSSWAPDLGD